MACPNCGGATTPDQKFCFQCGTELSAGCSNCGAAIPAGAKFCGECGTPTATASSTPEAADPAGPKPERRLVSVLFADLVGFTSASESRDPEEVREFLTRYAELASDTIHRYGGTVDKFIGDGVMAIWGTPRAFEDDPERAVRTALDLTTDVATLGDEFGIPQLQMRAGIATGEAAVTVEDGSHGMVAGDLVNTASRLETSAQPGTVLVNETTFLSTNEAIAYEDKGALTLKGKTEQVSVWRPLSVMAKRGGAGKSTGLEAPFVGRIPEFQLLRDIFKATTRDRRAHLVSVQGIPGIGKSRLTWEFEKHLDGLADLFYWNQGRAPAYGDGVTFWALGEMVRRRAGIAEEDDEATTIAQLDDTVGEFVPEADRSWVGGALQALLGVGEPPNMDRDELFAAWRSFFQHLASRQPTVMVFEDLQWADHGTIDFIESMLEWSRDYPLFIVTISRPELLDRRPNWGAGQRGFTGLHLEPLSPIEMSELLEGLVPGLPAEVTDRILERAEGVPLYAVETVRMLLGQGLLVEEGNAFRLRDALPELAVPETLHALVAARLDTLDPEARHLLQMASVLGQTFTAKALADLAGLGPGEAETRLEPLIRREILAIESDPRSPERGQYRFVQSVIKEVAYSGLPRTERSALHLRAAELMTELGDEELAGVIASHYLDAYHAIEERDRSPDLRRRALDALASAAERAYGLGSYEQAVGFFEQAMKVTDDTSRAASLAVRAGYSAVLAALYDVAQKHYSYVLEQAKAEGNQGLELEAVEGLTGVLLMESRVDEVLDLLGGYDELTTSEVTPGLAKLHAQMARAHAFAGHGDKAMEFIERALIEAGSLGLTELVADALVTKGWALTLEERGMEGEAVTEGALYFADRYGHSRPAWRARNNISSYLGWSAPATSLEVVLTGFEEATRNGNLEDRGNLGAKAVWGALESGDWDLAARLVDELSGTTMGWFAEAQFEEQRASLLAFRGNIEEANAILDELELRLESSSSEQDFLGFLIARANVSIAEGLPEKALAYTRELLGRGMTIWQHAPLVESINASIWSRDRDGLAQYVEAGEQLDDKPERFTHWLTIGHGALAALDGDSAAGSRLFNEAAKGLRGLGLKPDVARCQLNRVTVLGVGDEEGRQAAEEARKIYTDLGAVPFLKRLDELTGSV